ncbi:MAG: [FeFe] hydrogenase H-cluster radical SAM maturase HydE [Candidatus Scalindua sp. AMX11]|nr:MAG: [FeFe] hydrogenase H-cluster radical SAM maturase HydE [Candidatus Scalindua sp.]NOG82740.1 [FeFe] hydrogenase H-cluster radical SAM maturase HydE [Planctomycetota bacterium]RZV95309.1 MAG: [FeFe] hydrogenase H-cluster radical SAM maturase HydE [Candidatus Scalindua sp. SCAELEC01]TDE66208.1 MAG: [FeFe] hydrogenase H-cluster radical SAM maturase HydE [Candidatus Scalindua sp. AMX11]GJQ57829.1 MAG: [FeFe] hydrogenase H-cluster radical SAM maturase HydE [Candidatus Scalindua sp.]
MCYAIPGNVKSISDNLITIDYFGEERTARNDFYALQVGDYVYAQGGFVVQKIGKKLAEEILDSWKELFFELKETDTRLSKLHHDKTTISKGFLKIISKATYGGSISREEAVRLLLSEDLDELEVLHKSANFIRQKFLGNACCVHGIVEFSNNCMCQCAYCGINRSNINLTRYRLTPKQIRDIVGNAVERFGFKGIVLQSGEDPSYSSKEILNLIKMIMEHYPVFLFLSVGEREDAFYLRAFEAGARAVLFRFETSDDALYAKLHPHSSLKERMRYLKLLKNIGYLIATGSLIGLPQQNVETIIDDFLLAKELGADMYSFGPFIPHPGTPLSGYKAPDVGSILKALSVLRLIDPYGKILVTTALESLYPKAKRQALLCGANSVMLNLTPTNFAALYDIYPSRARGDISLEDQVTEAQLLLRSIGRAPTDLGL